MYRTRLTSRSLLVLTPLFLVVLVGLASRFGHRLTARAPASPYDLPVARIQAPDFAVAPEDLTQQERERLIQRALSELWRYVPNLDSEPPSPLRVTAENGQIAYVGTDGFLYLMNPSGAAQRPIITHLQSIAWPTWSRDSRYLAFVAGDADRDTGRCLYRLRAETGTVTQLLCGFAGIGAPEWSPDDTRIVFYGASESDSDYHAWALDADGSNLTELAPNLYQAYHPTWVDRQTVVLPAESRTDVWQLFRVDLAAADSPRPITPEFKCTDPCQCAGGEIWAGFPDASPDGQHVAFVGGRTEGDKYSCTAYYAVYTVDQVGAAPPDKIADVADTSGGTATAGLVKWAPSNEKVALYAGGSDSVLRLNIVDLGNRSATALRGREGGTWTGFDWAPSSTMLVAGYHPPEAVGEVNKVDPESDTFTTLASGGSPAWGSISPEPPIDLEATGLEVTQAIQRFDLRNPASSTNNSVPLILGKETVVRVFPRILDQEAEEWMKTTARVWRELPNGTKVEAEPLNGPITPKQTADRNQQDHSLNFRLALPDDLDNQQVTIYAELNADRSVFESNYDNNTISVTLPLTDVPSVDLIGVPVRYEFGDTIAEAPTVAELGRAVARLRQIYPLGDEDVDLIPYHNYERPFTIGCDLNDLDNCWADSLASLARQIALDQGYQDLDNPRVYGLLPDHSDEAPGYWHGYGARNPDEERTDLPPAALARNLDDGVGDRAGNLVAHEFGHTFGLSHTVPLTYAPIINTGYNTVRDEVLENHEAPREDRYHDIMSYVFSRMWISVDSYEGILSRMQWEGNDAQVRSLVEQPALLVTGILDKNDQVVLSEFYVVDRDIGTTLGTSGEYVIELRDENESLLVAHHFNVDFETAFADGPSPGDAPAIFAEWIPFDAGTARFVMRHESEVLAQRQLSDHTPQVALQHPNGGESWLADTNYTIRWSARDDDGDSLTYAVRYRHAPDTPWTVLAADLTIQSLTVNTTELAGGSEASIQVLATDGIRTGVDASDATFSVISQSPQAYILFPRERQMMGPGKPIFLIGYAFDPEDGILEGESLRWTIDGDTEIGSGPRVETTLALGSQGITLTATDSQGNQASDSVHIHVGYQSYLPLLIRNMSGQ